MVSAPVGGRPAGLANGSRRLEAEPGDLPYTAGWSVAAIAIHSVLQIPVPMLLRLMPPGRGTILVDFRHHAFSWEHAMRDFPVSPSAVGVETVLVLDDDPAPFELPGQNLDILLWSIGLHSFADRPASWLRPGDRHHLTRWPNLTTMRHTVDHMRLTALLGNGWFTVRELATEAGVPENEAGAIVNALSLMNVVESVSCEEAAPSRRGIVRHLRGRLGL